MNIKADLNGFKHSYNIFFDLTWTFAQNRDVGDNRDVVDNRNVGEIIDIS